MKDYPEIGETVIVTPKPDSGFKNEFVGTVSGIWPDPTGQGDYVVVRDQEDDCWTCELDQIEYLIPNLTLFKSIVN